jgi:hypothetical protein
VGRVPRCGSERLFHVLWKATITQVQMCDTAQTEFVICDQSIDTNHGYAKEQVVNSELAKRQVVLEGRVHRLEHRAQASRARLIFLRDQDQHLQEQAQAYEQQWMELSLQVLRFEATNQTEERDYFPLKARQLATDWEVRQRKAKLEKNAVRRLRILNKCEGYCQELRQVLRRQEDLESQAREMYELDVRPVQPKLAP